METIQKKLKQDSHESIFVSIITIVLGIVMIIFSKNILNMISYIIGGILLINGLIKIYYYFKLEGKYNIFNYDLSFGILSILVAIVCVLFKSELQSIFRIIIGLVVIYEGILNISLASKVFFVSKSAGIFSFLLTLLMIACGGIIMWTKGIVIATIGGILIAFAVMNMIESIIFYKNISKIEKFFSQMDK